MEIKDGLEQWGGIEKICDKDRQEIMRNVCDDSYKNV